VATVPRTEEGAVVELVGEVMEDWEVSEVAEEEEVARREGILEGEVLGLQSMGVNQDFSFKWAPVAEGEEVVVEVIWEAAQLDSLQVQVVEVYF
jgi:hypothetical protein